MNQAHRAFAIVCSLCTGIARGLAGDAESESAVVAWQGGRQERIYRVLDLITRLDKR